MRTILFIAATLAGLGCCAQTTVTLTEDWVLTETYVIDENTTVIGNGFKMICNGCNPMIRVVDGAMADFQDVRFARGYESFIRVTGGEAAGARWVSPAMEGSINWIPFQPAGQ